MTHHSSRSSSFVSRRNRSSTHPQLAVQPTQPVRVRRGARLRSRPSSQLQQTYHQRRPTWQQQQQRVDAIRSSHQDDITPEDFKYSPVPESFTSSPRDLPSNQQDLFPFEASTPPPSHHDYTPLSVTTPPTQHGFRCTSEPALLVSYPAASDTESLEGGFNWTNSPTAELNQAQQCADLQDMSTLGYMLPAHFSPLEPFPPVLDSTEFMDSHHSSHYLTSSSAQQVLPTPTSAPSSAYLPSFPPSPALLGSSPSVMERRLSGSRQDPPVMPPYPHRNSYHGSTNSPYQPPMSSPYQTSSLRTSPAPLSYGQSSADTPSILSAPVPPTSYSPIPSNISSQGLGGLSYGSSYPPPPQYVSNAYDLPSYHSSPQSLYPQTSASSYPPAYLPPTLSDHAPTSASSATASSATIDGRNVRVINQRPKPQCWEHGCNGRQFSTFSNLLRHQREKSGTAGKSYCPRCGAEFTRTTAMKGHMNNDKCKPRRTSGASETAS